MRIEGVVFDLDHTLYDRYGTLRAMAGDFCLAFGEYIAPGISVKDAAELLCETDKTHIYFGWRTVFDLLCERGLFAKAPDYEEYRKVMLALFTSYAVPYPFTKGVLRAVRERGMKTALITNGAVEIQKPKIEMLSLESFFDEIIICGEIGAQKPDPAPFKEMAKRLCLPESVLLYVGDDPVRDVEGARNAGYTPVEVLTTRCVVPGTVPAKYRINSVAELPELLDGLLRA